MNSIKSNFIYSCLYQIVNIVVPLITTPYLSRVLGANGVGEYSYAFSIAQMYAIFILLGLNNYGNREISSVRDSKDNLKKTFWSIYSMQLFLGVLICIVYFGFYVRRNSDYIIPLILGLYVISTCFDINWFYFGIEKFKFISIRNIIIKLFSAVLIFGFVKSEVDTKLYCLIMGMSFILSQLSLWPYVIINVKPTRINFIDILRHIKPNLLLFITVIAVNIYKYMDKVMIGNLSTYEEVGYYELSEKVVIIPTSLVTALGTAILPRASYLVAKGDRRNDNLIERSNIFAMLFSTSICFGLMSISNEFVPLYYGDGYNNCIMLFIALLPSGIFFAFANIIRTQYLIPHNMDKYYVISAIIGAITNVLINLIFIPKYGAIGAAVGTTCAEFSVCFYQAFSVRKLINIKKMIIDACPYVESGLVMFLVLYFIDTNLSIYLDIVIEIFLGIIIYFTMVYILLKRRNRNVNEIFSMFRNMY